MSFILSVLGVGGTTNEKKKNHPFVFYLKCLFSLPTIQSPLRFRFFPSFPTSYTHSHAHPHLPTATEDKFYVTGSFRMDLLLQTSFISVNTSAVTRSTKFFSLFVHVAGTRPRMDTRPYFGSPSHLPLFYYTHIPTYLGYPGSSSNIPQP